MESLVRELDRPLHGGGEGRTVEVEGVGVGDLLPELRPHRRARLELDRPMEQGQRLLDVVPTHRQGRGPAQPDAGSLLDAAELRILGPPGQVHVLRPDGLGVMMGEERRVLVASVPGQLEPRAEARMKPRPSRLRQAPVGDIPGERVRDRELALARDRRALPVAARTRAPPGGRSPAPRPRAAPGPDPTRRCARSPPPPAARPSRTARAGRCERPERPAPCRGRRRRPASRARSGHSAPAGAPRRRTGSPPRAGRRPPAGLRESHREEFVDQARRVRGGQGAPAGASRRRPHVPTPDDGA